MTRHRTTRVVAILGILGLLARGWSASSTAADERYHVIVHPKNPAAWIDQAFLRNAYLKKEIEWSDGRAILPVDLAPGYPVRQQFIHDVLRKTDAQLKRYWSQRIFSGKGAPPPEAAASVDVIAYVLANPGAIGYIPADLAPGGAKVIEVR
jgi:hypothetical protein